VSLLGARGCTWQAAGVLATTVASTGPARSIGGRARSEGSICVGCGSTCAGQRPGDPARAAARSDPRVEPPMAVSEATRALIPAAEAGYNPVDLAFALS